MNKRFIIPVFVAVIIFITVVLFLYKPPSKEIECQSNSVCDFFYSTYGNSSCVSCSYGDKEWICMNKDKAEAEIKRIIDDYFDGFPPLCERCLETDYDSYACNCLDNKCVKIRK